MGLSAIASVLPLMGGEGPFSPPEMDAQPPDPGGSHRRLNNAQWTVTSGGSYCALSTDDAGNPCVQDTLGHYGASEDCSFTLETGGATLVRMEWGLEDESSCTYDYLQLDGGTKYCGTASYAEAFPASMAVSGAMAFAFHSDDDEFGAGFKICAQPPAGTTWPPTPVPPTPPPTPATMVASWAEAKTAIESIASGSSGTVTLATGFNCVYNGQITIAGDVTVHGNGAICDSSAQAGRFFAVNSGARLALDAMTLRNGKAEINALLPFPFQFSVSMSSSH